MNTKKNVYNVVYRTAEGVVFVGSFKGFSGAHAIEEAYAKNRIFYPHRKDYVAKESKNES